MTAPPSRAVPARGHGRPPAGVRIQRPVPADIQGLLLPAGPVPGSVESARQVTAAFEEAAAARGPARMVAVALDLIGLFARRTETEAVADTSAVGAVLPQMADCAFRGLRTASLLAAHLLPATPKEIAATRKAARRAGGVPGWAMAFGTTCVEHVESRRTLGEMEEPTIEQCFGLVTGGVRWSVIVQVCVEADGPSWGPLLHAEVLEIIVLDGPWDAALARDPLAGYARRWSPLDLPDALAMLDLAVEAHDRSERSPVEWPWPSRVFVLRWLSACTRRGIDAG